MQTARKSYHGKTDCDTMKCTMEEWVRSRRCFVLIHDGSKSSMGRRSVFTRQYVLVWRGRVTPYSIKFYYDYRENLADFTLDDVSREVMKQLGKMQLPIEEPPPEKNSFWATFKWAFGRHDVPINPLPKTQEQLESEVIEHVLENKKSTV